MSESATFMAYAPTPDQEASRAFYLKLGFEVHRDGIDGSGVRRLRMKHRLLPAVLLNLKHVEPASAAAAGQSVSSQVLFSIVDAGDFDWRELVKKEDLLVEDEVSLTAAIWTYLRDPGGNLICLTTSDVL